MTNSFQWSFLLGRLAVGMSMFGHGLVRLPKLAGFSSWMIGQFQKSMLPVILVKPFSYALPIAELLVGLFLLLGLFTRQALIAGGFVMISLIFGTSMIEEWSAIPSQLIHTAFFSVMLCFVRDYNFYAIDNLKRKS
ncbi:DoxX family membrane protein [Dyadobacter psychrotolerans]|uniref:DoxX family membrane protein n=1 Tax=Dyadobacter psychrotolerans TaxID=2541721 RepID=A0A4R5DTC3_9BACT|nr:DoxX family membrane protein [Dyadobacter psychrotolerans]TDE17659.1 DoxX family membrane protein [Dyadobacter psychrotolerans]